MTYSIINPDCVQHCVYSHRTCDNLYIPEVYRLYFTRMRLSSHMLKIETGRWSRIARERRLCNCGSIQDERHVLCDCLLTDDCRLAFGKPVRFPSILQEANSETDFKLVYNVLRFF